MTVQVAFEALGIELYCPTCETSYAVGLECPEDGTRLVNLAPPTDALVGRDIDGRFTILERLGQGGMGAVYRASQHSVGREVAIKVVHANLASDPSVIKRFLREARLASKLTHPNAVGVLDFGQTVDGLFYLVLELVTGQTLADVIEKDPAFDARRVIRIGLQICEALEAAHQLSIIHRDLKPANIMILDVGNDTLKVLDFGLAKLADGGSASEVTGSNGLVGTPAFMPPERAVGESGDARSDLYSLGCILYLLGSGKPPFESANLQDLLMQQVSTSAPPMTNVPFALAAVIDRLLLKKPDDRYQTARATREALEDALADLPAARTGRRSSQPSLRFPAAAAVLASLESSSTRMVREELMLAPTAVKEPPIERRRARWPWVVAGLAAAGGAVCAIAPNGGAVAAPPVVTIPIPTPMVVPLPPPPVAARPAIVPTPAQPTARPGKGSATAPAKRTRTKPNPFPF